jgi:hypothetical protein
MSAAAAHWNTTIIAAAVAEYRLQHALEQVAHAEMARHAAVRGMMVRLGIYGEFCAALEKAQMESLEKASTI